MILLGGAIFLSATDFITTSTAIGMGLQEGNYALITLSQSLGIGLLTTLGLTKAFFAFGCCAASFVGIRMRGNATGWLAVSVLAGFVLIQLAVSVNNFSIIIG